MANPTTYFGWVMPTSSSLVTNLPADFNTFGQGVDTSLQDLLGGTTGQVLSKTSATNMDFTWVTPTDQTPLTTKGDLFTFTTVDARLGVGTNGYILSANSATATGLEWIAANPGDITGVTAGTGISGGGTSGDVTVTNSMATAMTTKGDLVPATGSGAFARLGVGANDTVLTADSTAATGMKWATPASSTPTFVGASVYSTADQTINTATDTALTWSDELFDTDGFHSTSTNTSRMTIPAGKAGKYLVAGTSTWGPDRTGRCQQIIYKNGSVFAYVIAGPMSQSPGQNYTLIMDLAVADYVEVFARQDTGSSATITKTTSQTRFQIEYLGA